ncbi:MAG: SH3 domain-containing protein [Nitrospinae bacterium]|nr:SH3 domain-containing protein [Nitrospinota bacterium]
MKRALLITAILALLPGMAAAADALFVQSAKAKIMSEPNFKAETVGTVNRGDRLERMETKDAWFKVKTGGKAGWINRLAVADTPPMDKVTVITADAEDLQEKSRKRSSAITSAAAARGLSDAERKRMSDIGQADHQSLARLEKVSGSITDQELLDFEAGN